MALMDLLPSDMETFASREAKNAFGRLIDTAQRQPVTIERNGRPVAVVLSKHDYDMIQQDLQEYRSLKETEYLLASPANRERLLTAIEQDRRGAKATTQSLADLRAHED